MPLTPDEAERSLRDIQAAGRRSRSAYGHNAAAPHLIVWGVVWFVGYGPVSCARAWRCGGPCWR